ncbi:hypothetical protein QR685DRAFT_513296 [Neurospora intermedia]|uniref:Questionable protein n=1 Tax=Neurospora intermedia TaxID=5142 RepID=A0ABR3DSL6_NEUIN
MLGVVASSSSSCPCTQPCNIPQTTDTRQRNTAPRINGGESEQRGVLVEMKKHIHHDTQLAGCGRAAYQPGDVGLFLLLVLGHRGTLSIHMTKSTSLVLLLWRRRERDIITNHGQESLDGHGPLAHHAPSG